MLPNLKLLCLFIVLCCAINVSAWSDESNIEGNESLSYGVSTIFNESTVNDPYRYFDTDKELFNVDAVSNDPVEMCTTYYIYKYEYDTSTSSYVKNTNCVYSIEECVTFVYRERNDGTPYWVCPDMAQQMTDGYLIRTYFQSMLNGGHVACAEYEATDETDKPDRFGIEAHADVDNDDLDQVFSGYVEFDTDTERELTKNQNYGFDIDSICGEGGSGDLANAVGWGSMDEASTEHKSIFEKFFYTLVPIIFVLLVLKMIGKVGN